MTVACHPVSRPISVHDFSCPVLPAAAIWYVMGLPMNDAELLRRYANDGSPEAFRELVARHTNFVYSCACQRLHDAHAAEDVTQAVFLALARQAKNLSLTVPLPGWLYQVTKFTCAMHQRRETRRKDREMHASEQQLAPDTTTALWQEIEPHLSGAGQRPASSAAHPRRR